MSKLEEILKGKESLLPIVKYLFKEDRDISDKSIRNEKKFDDYFDYEVKKNGRKINKIWKDGRY